MQLNDSCRMEAVYLMGAQLEKLIKRLLCKPSDFTYSEARKLLGQLGYTEYNKGKTSGSRVKFYRESDGAMILLHKPHPGDIMDKGAVNSLIVFLTERGELS